MIEEDSREMTIELLDFLLKPMQLKVKNITWEYSNWNTRLSQDKAAQVKVYVSLISLKMPSASVDVHWGNKFYSYGITSLGFSLEECMQNIAKYLMGEIYEFEIEYPISSEYIKFDTKDLQIKNIYLGCKSIEEMMITRDLARNED